MKFGRQTGMKASELTKIVVVNIGIITIIAGSIETVCYIMLRSKGYKPQWMYEYKTQLADPCQIMTGHPLLGNSHKEGNNCGIKKGKSIGDSYVLYNDGANNEDVILTLGGSTTDGFYNHINSGDTWPMYLSEILKKKSVKIGVINGGVGGYSSQKELIKLLISIDNIQLHKKIKLIVSLNGINEMPGYDFENNYNAQNDLPYWNKTQVDMFAKKRFINIDSDKSSPHIYMSSLFETLGKLQEKNKRQNARLEENIRKNFVVFFNSKTDNIKDYEMAVKKAASSWKRNIERMNALASTINAEYVVFLQPTMGIEGTQIPEKGNSRDRKLYDETSEIYKERINILYKNLKERCKRIKYCIDISDDVKPTGNVYNDPRHHNEKGNMLLAETIYNELEKQTRGFSEMHVKKFE